MMSVSIIVDECMYLSAPFRSYLASRSSPFFIRSAVLAWGGFGFVETDERLTEQPDVQLAKGQSNRAARCMDRPDEAFACRV